MTLCDYLRDISGSHVISQVAAMYRLCIGNSYNNNNKLYLVTRIESKALLRSVDSVYKKYNKSTSKPYEYVYLNHCCTELNYRT